MARTNDENVYTYQITENEDKNRIGQIANNAIFFFFLMKWFISTKQKLYTFWMMLQNNEEEA